MVINIASLLDKAQVMHRLPSDYKLALVMGISHSSLTSYRAGKTLPDARVISKICELTGDDPALLAAQVEAERAKTGEARALWLQVVSRLQSTVHAAFFAVVAGGVLFGFSPNDAHAKTPPVFDVHSLYIVEYQHSLMRVVTRFFKLMQCYFWRFCQIEKHVPRPPSTAHA